MPNVTGRPALIQERYRVVDDHVFPAAVVFVVPRHEATR